MLNSIFQIASKFLLIVWRQKSVFLYQQLQVEAEDFDEVKINPGLSGLIITACDFVGVVHGMIFFIEAILWLVSRAMIQRKLAYYLDLITLNLILWVLQEEIM